MKLLYILLAFLMLHAIPLSSQHRWFGQSDLVGYSIISICRDSSAGVWAVVAHPGFNPVRYSVQRFDGAQWKSFSTSTYTYPFSESRRLWDIACTAKGSIVVGADAGIALFDPATLQWRQSEYADTEHDLRLYTSVISDTDGTIWVSSDASKVRRTDTVNGTVLRFIDYTHYEILSLDEDMWTLRYRVDSLAYGITNPCVDEDGSIWSATRADDGRAIEIANVTRQEIKRTLVDCRSLPDGQIGSVQALHKEKDGTLLLGTASYAIDGKRIPSQLIRIDPSDNSIFLLGTFPGMLQVNSIIQKDDGLYLVGVKGSNFDHSGLYTVHGNTVSKIDVGGYFPSLSLPDGVKNVHDMVFAADTLFCGTGSGVAVLAPFQPVADVTDGGRITAGGELVPNPVAPGSLVRCELEFSAGEAATDVRLYNVLGKLCEVRWRSDRGIPVIDLGASFLPDGAYYVVVKTDRNRIWSRPLVVTVSSSN